MDVVQRLRTDVVQRPRGWTGDIPEVIIEKPHWEGPPRPNFRNIQITDGANGYRKVIADPDCEWISDFLYDEEWTPGDYAFLDASCSAGKNTFVEYLTNQRRYDRILILANRRANKRQILERLGIQEDRLFQRADIRTYQSLELDSSCWSRELDHYAMIVVDEAHYYVCDSLFNGRANISLEKIMGTEYPVKLFMSATITEVQELVMGRLRKQYDNITLAQKCSVYQMKRNKQNITSVNCIDFGEIIKAVKASEDKWMIFVDSKDLGKDFVEELGDSAIFISSESSTDDPKAKKEYEHIIEHECFQHQVLVATSVLDNGINIKDRSVRNIVIANNDRIEMVQMLGRKRCIDESDTFNLYLQYTDKAEIVKALNMNREEQKQWLEIKTHLDFNDGFPPLPYSLNSDDGEEQREMIYMQEKRREFVFNYLGFKGLKIRENMLIELAKAEDIFMTKLNWLFGDFGLPYVGSSEQDVISRRITRIMDAIEPFVQKCCPVKSEEFTSFREVFSQKLWENFSLDKEDNHRSDRILKAAKINTACKKLGIPIELVKKSIGRVTHYEIVRTDNWLG